MIDSFKNTQNTDQIWCGYVLVDFQRTPTDCANIQLQIPGSAPAGGSEVYCGSYLNTIALQNVASTVSGNFS